MSCPCYWEVQQWNNSIYETMMKIETNFQIPCKIQNNEGIETSLQEISDTNGF